MYIIITREVLGKDIPVPKSLLAFNSLATLKVLRSFALVPKEDIKCVSVPRRGSQTSASSKWVEELHRWSSEN